MQWWFGNPITISIDFGGLNSLLFQYLIISVFEKLYQTYERVFYQIFKLLEVGLKKKDLAQFYEFGYSDETLPHVNILRETYMK